MRFNTVFSGYSELGKTMMNHWSCVRHVPTCSDKHLSKRAKLSAGMWALSILDLFAPCTAKNWGLMRIFETILGFKKCQDVLFLLEMNLFSGPKISIGRWFMQFPRKSQILSLKLEGFPVNFPLNQSIDPSSRPCPAFPSRQSADLGLRNFQLRRFKDEPCKNQLMATPGPKWGEF